MDNTKKELVEEVQQFLRKIKADNNLNFKDFERIVVTAANNVTKEFGDKEELNK